MKLLRPYQESDKEILTDMLRGEGIPDIEISFEEYPTMVLEDDKEIIGFFTLKTSRNFPMLQHFCVKQNRRSFKTALFLVKCFRKVIQELGFIKVIIQIKKDYLKTMVEWCFHTKAYAFTADGSTWFLVKV